MKISAQLPAAPTSAPATGRAWDPRETYPAWSIITFEFPARAAGELPPVKLVWYDGNKRPPRPADLEPDRDFAKVIPGDGGSYFLGDKGTIVSGAWGGCRIIPEAKMKAYKPPAKSIPRSNGMHEDWVVACKGGQPASSNFIDFAAGLTEIVLLGVIAQRTGRPLEYDFKAMKFTNDPEANALLKREPRKGWAYA